MRLLFCGAVRAKVTSEPIRPSTQVEVPDENKVSLVRVCEKQGADPDILETLMEDMEVLDHRQIVFMSDQENPVKAVQRALQLGNQR